MSDLPPDFTDLIERNRDRIEEISRRHGIRGDAVGDLLVQAGHEVLMRQRITLDEEGRFLRSFDRHCREHARRYRGEVWRRVLDLYPDEGVPEGEEAASGHPGGAEAYGSEGGGSEPSGEDDPENERRAGGEGER